jgi:signal transduction histidine kinase
MRSSTLVRKDLSEALRTVGDELAAGDASQFRLVVEGSPRDVHTVVHDEVYLIAREAIRNAFCHAQAKIVEAEITYSESLLRLCVRDDGKGNATVQRSIGGPRRRGPQRLRQRPFDDSMSAAHPRRLRKMDA